MADSLHLRLFGPPELLGPGGQAVRFRTRKQLGLVVYLHLEARVHGVARDELVELLWSEVSCDKGRHSLAQACTTMRHILGPDALERRGDSLWLRAPLSSDLDTLSAGVDGPINLLQPLRGLDQWGGPAFAHWVDGARARIQSEARETLMATLAKARASGQASLAYRSAHLLLQLDPACAPAVLVAAERALLDGDTIGAIRLLRDCAAKAEQELGSVPHPEIPRLLKRLERGEAVPLLPSSEARRTVKPRREVFVGREREMAMLEAAWVSAKEASFLGCLVTGPPGIGKSSLLRRFATAVAARAAPVFVVPCQEIGAGIPFAAVSDLIRAVGHDPSASGTDPRWLAEASRVSPGLRVMYPGIPEPPDAPADSVRLRVAEALHRMLEVVSDGMPVLVAFDDMQHMDHASREVIFLLSRGLERARVMLVACARTDEPRRAVDELAGRGFTWRERVALESLGTEQVLHLIGQLTDAAGPVEPPIRDKIVSLAQGNPFHIEMLLEDYRQHTAASLVGASEVGVDAPAAWRPPETLRLAFARLYDGLPRECQHVLHVMAVAGRAMEPGNIARLLGLEPRSVDREMLEIVERGIVRVEGARVDFKTDLHRAYVYWAVSPDTRRYHHGRLGAFLASGAGPEDFQRLLEASHHFVPAGMRDEAIAAARAGAEIAVAQGAMREAERALRTLFRAYPELRQHHHLAILFATALLAEGQFQGALEALPCEEGQIADPLLAARSAGIRAEALHRGRLADDQAIRVATGSALLLARLASNDEAIVRALQVTAEIAFDVGQIRTLHGIRQEVLQIGEAATSEVGKALAAKTAGYCSLILGQLADARATFDTIAPSLERLSRLSEYRRVLNGLGMCLTGLGQLEQARECFIKAIHIARRVGDTTAERNVWSNLGSMYHDRGFYRAAAESCSRAIEHSEDEAPSRITVDTLVNAALLAVDLGSFREAEALSAAAESSAKATRLWYDDVTSHLTRAHVLLARGDPETAWALIDRAMQTVRGNAFYLTDYGLYGRLTRHFVWATQGWDALRAIVDPYTENPKKIRLAHRLEIEAFCEYAASRSGSVPPQTSSAVDRLRRHSMFGRLSRLAATRVTPPGVPALSDGVPSARLIWKLFRPEAEAPPAYVQCSAGADAPKDCA